MKKLAGLLLAASLAGGCSSSHVPPEQPPRIRIISWQTLESNNSGAPGRRDAFVLEDTETGRQYLLVSGAQTGSAMVEIPK